MNIQNILALIIFIVIAQAAGGVGALFNVKSIPAWYKGLKKSKLNPPNGIFGPVWTLLFLLMGVAAFLVWRQYGAVANNPQTLFVWKWAMIFYIVQLVLNVLWSAIFFGWHRPGAALAEIILLWLAILLTMVHFWQISPLAGWLMLPYILWVSFAAYLNYAVWRLNSK